MLLRKKILMWSLLVSILGFVGLAFGEALFWFSGMVPPQTTLVEDDRLGWVLTDAPDHTPKADETRPTVVVLGDSFTAPGGFIHAASKVLEESGCSLHFVNLGVHGYGQMQQWKSWTVFGAAHKPDHVLLAAFLWNDLGDNLNDIYYSYTAHVNRPEMRIIDKTVQIKDKSTFDILPDSLLENSHLARGIEFLYFNIFSPYHNYGHPKAWGDFYLKQEPPRATEGYAVYKEILRRLAEDVQKKGSNLAILSFDNGFTVLPETLKEAADLIADKNMPYSLEDLDIDRPQNRSRQIVAELGLPFLDGTKALRATSEPSYGPGLSGHFTPAGDQAIGLLIADHLKQQGLCPSIADNAPATVPQPPLPNAL